MTVNKLLGRELLWDTRFKGGTYHVFQNGKDGNIETMAPGVYVFTVQTVGRSLTVPPIPLK